VERQSVRGTAPRKVVHGPRKAILKTHRAILTPRKAILTPRKAIHAPRKAILKTHGTIHAPYKAVLAPRKAVFKTQAAGCFGKKPGFFRFSNPKNPSSGKNVRWYGMGKGTVFLYQYFFSSTQKPNNQPFKTRNMATPFVFQSEKPGAFVLGRGGSGPYLCDIKLNEVIKSIIQRATPKEALSFLLKKRQGLCRLYISTA
jgi:hypothetical protein